MSESPPPSALGKRAHDGGDVEEDNTGNRSSGAVVEDVDMSDDEDVGPMPMPGAAAPRKKRKVLPHERLFLDHLPSADRYSKSFMHRDVLNFVTVTKKDFIITTSVDGHLKLWQKQTEGIEFVKHYRAHMAPIVHVSASADGTLFASVAEDGSTKVFDVINFDMITMLKLEFTPKACCWVHKPGEALSLLAISEEGSNVIRLYDGRGDGTPMHILDKLHKSPVHIMEYSPHYDTVVSADEGGFVEYWRPQEPWDAPKDIRGIWEFKASTDLYHFKKTKNIPTAITFSPNSSHFVTIAFPSRHINIFNFLTGKLTRTYDESLSAIQEMQQAGTAVYKVDDMEFGRRLAVERELEKDERAWRTMKAVWDESGNFVIYPTLLGIKVVNVVTNRVSRLLGKDETGRWLNLSLYQGAPSKKGVSTIAMAASSNPILQNRESRDPTLFCTAFKRPRFYMFTRNSPEDSRSHGDRDVFNERPTRDEQTLAIANAPSAKSALPTTATIHTTMGDISFKLFPEYAPKAVENFFGLSKRGYYDGVIFHRVIKKFMLQTGDPLGDGTGGDSVWGKEFEDEFNPALRHDRPYTLSMANAGPNTNGSQFFITTTVCPWLDNKHTIFGRALTGLEVIHNIENVRTSKTDKPFEDIKIVNVDVA
ncbi:hypothetical protein FRB93_005386 [Tulasnella sp. JGI-2019a]|nr:hypothetical protein FRB93_005386 [Tulasnella sp. JGI-2019a]